MWPETQPKSPCMARFLEAWVTLPVHDPHSTLRQQARNQSQTGLENEDGLGGASPADLEKQSWVNDATAVCDWCLSPSVAY